MPMTTSDARARIADLLPQLRADLEALVRIESVSADPARLSEVEKSAEFASASAKEGKDYDELINWIVDLASARYSR